MSMKVIGAGFGRTGTSSLQAALEELGFGKCYHMREFFVHPDRVPLWVAAGQGQPVDWDRVFEGYQSTVDWPACTFYRDLMEHYPDAKVLLSVRDPDKWYASALNTIYRSHLPSLSNWLYKWNPRTRQKWLFVSSMWRNTFQDRFEDKEFAIEVFKRHNAEVQRVVPAERLLVYDVKQGWEPLCRFLNVPVPDKPFPHLNDTAEFQQMIVRRERKARVQVGAIASLVALAIVGMTRLRQRQIQAALR